MSRPKRRQRRQISSGMRPRQQDLKAFVARVWERSHRPERIVVSLANLTFCDHMLDLTIANTGYLVKIAVVEL